MFQMQWVSRTWASTEHKITLRAGGRNYYQDCEEVKLANGEGGRTLQQEDQ